MKGIVLVVAVTFAAGMVAGKFVFRDAVAATGPCQNPNDIVSSIPEEYLAPVTPDQMSIPATPQFRCDGRQHCTEMSSKAEAQFFLEHCPDTKMDGDNDGEACEQQF
jgi:hypothetical protein